MGAGFEGRKLVVIGGASGMGREAAATVLRQGGSAVIMGRGGMKLDAATAELSKIGSTCSIAVDLADQAQVDEACKQLAEQHADANLLVNAAGFYLPKAFLDVEGPDYDSYHDINR